jgi:diguanylate cyclase (GGDEF)-like protein/PAS domain S-box-containing protein
MFPNLKLATFTWILSIIMALIIAIIFVSSFLIEKNMTVIYDTWDRYQTDLSDKSRLENSIRAQIGYGGMVHNFKNYILRQDETYLKRAESQLASAEVFLQQYKSLILTPVETAAIDDILNVFSDYHKGLSLAQILINQGHSIAEVNDAVKINDQPAIRGLQILRDTAIAPQKIQPKLSKHRILADLRAALGYGGMINQFKDYLLNHEKNLHKGLKDDRLRNQIGQKIRAALDSIQRYRQHTLSESEQLALNDIELTLKDYSDKLNEIEPLMERHLSLKESDAQNKVDDSSAIRGFQLLEQQINVQIAVNKRDVSKALNSVTQTIEFSKWVIGLAVLLMTLIFIILIRFYVTLPILRLTKSMVLLADNKLDTEVTDHQANNEIGQMARAVKVFKNDIIKLFESEKISDQVNDQLRQKLQENKQLRRSSEAQTNKALSMAEHMAKAREAAEQSKAIAEKNELLFSSILNTVRDGIITIDAQGIIETFNPGSERIFGYKAAEVLGKNISLLMPDPHKNAHDEYMKQHAEGKTTRDQSIPLDQNALRKNGELFPAEITINTVKVGNEFKITGLVRDITERKIREEQIEKMAMTDSLTGLANRNQYTQRLHQIEQHAKRFKTLFCLMIIDLDKFKPVNDDYGHHVGDILLQQVAEVLLASCREIDTVARLGGDEFSIIINGVNEPKEVEILAHRILDKLANPFNIENKSIQISASIGISCYPSDTTDMETLQRTADAALYASKEGGRNTYRFYSEP